MSSDFEMFLHEYLSQSTRNSNSSLDISDKAPFHRRQEILHHVEVPVENVTSHNLSHLNIHQLSPMWIDSEGVPNSNLIPQELPDFGSIFNDDLLPEELPDDIKTMFTMLYVVIIVLALSGNLTTIFVIAFNREMRTVTNTFLLSLAVSDALIAIVNMPVQLKFYLQNEWLLGEVLCKLTSYMQGVVIVASIFTLTGLAIDR